ncbi:alternate signal-mediated exported protein [Microterricola gilva]|uniref:Alternate signal-mediated exported protein n=1 Tax=Microterricola gilva TaxID=393267 RepID=A0A4Q8AQQ4_9MICO|nr:hypothetical protein [Microterricola gilva]RZU67072.1 alternate signal-mediated exported protein [Microterricola gilva]
MKTSLSLAVVAGLAAVLLLSAPGSMAFLTDATPGPATIIQSGNLSMSVSAPTAVANEVYGTVPAGTVVRKNGAINTPGIVPGIQRQSYTYTITNTGSARATAKLSASLAFSALVEPRYSQLRSALQVAVSIDGQPEVIVVAAGSMPATAGTVEVPAQPLVFAPGVAHTVAVRFSIPATSGTSFATLGGRSAAATASSLFTLTPTFTLTQVPVTP